MRLGNFAWERRFYIVCEGFVMVSGRAFLLHRVIDFLRSQVGDPNREARLAGIIYSNRLRLVSRLIGKLARN